MIYKKETLLIHSGLNTDKQYGSVIPPLYLSNNYNFIDFNKPRIHDYSRRTNPTRDIVQNLLTKLEHGKGAVLTNTGMSAIHLVTIMLLKPNDCLIAPHDCYGGTYRLFNSLNEKGNYRVKFIDQNNYAILEKELQKKPKLIWIESPSNPLLSVLDIKFICNLAKKMGTISIVDNTFLSPILQNPLNLGADLVVHSCTKYLNGHSDIISGAVIAKDSNIAIDLAWWANNIGVTCSAIDSYLLLRGLRTLSARVLIAQNNALIIINFLKKQYLVKKIYHPSLPNNIGHKYALLQQRGFGSILSFELDVDQIKIQKFLKTLKIFTLAESLGGMESLISHSATMTHASMPFSVRDKAGISDKLLRISVGIEHYEDLISDLNNAFFIISR